MQSTKIGGGGGGLRNPLFFFRTKKKCFNNNSVVFHYKNHQLVLSRPNVLFSIETKKKKRRLQRHEIKELRGLRGQLLCPTARLPPVPAKLVHVGGVPRKHHRQLRQYIVQVVCLCIRSIYVSIYTLMYNDACIYIYIEIWCSVSNPSPPLPPEVRS